jgi:hypothetical protein
MIAIFIPYRNRKDHLDKLLESLNYPNISIHVLEQDNNDLFNRGKLFNIGAKEYLDKYEYLIFHDVDLIPQDADYNYKPTIPTHYSCFCEQFGYKLFDVEESEYLKSQLFGGVIAMKKKDFINYVNEIYNFLQNNLKIKHPKAVEYCGSTACVALNYLKQLLCCYMLLQILACVLWLRHNLLQLFGAALLH